MGVSFIFLKNSVESTSLSCGMSKLNTCKNQKQPLANVLQDRCSSFANFTGKHLPWSIS